MANSTTKKYTVIKADDLLTREELESGKEHKGLVSLDQIEHGRELLSEIEELKKMIQNLNFDSSKFRRKDEYILESDLDPSIRQKISYLTDNYDMVLDLIAGIETSTGEVLGIRELLQEVADNKDAWNSSFENDQYTKVIRI